MFNLSDAIAWVGGVAIFDDGGGGYILVKNGCNPLHISV